MVLRKGRWDFYMCQVEGRLASIFLDLDLRQQAGDPALPNMGYIRIFMLSPRDDGLSSNEEAPRLSALEDVVIAELSANPSTIFVGRNTTNGFRDLVFYTEDGSTWTERAAAAMSAHRDYKYECGGRPDPEWKVYCDFLFPDDIQLHRMGNCSVCYSLRDQGDALTEPRDVRHWIYLPTISARQEYVDWAIARGFSVQETPDASGNLRFGLCLSRNDLPSFKTIDDITLPLHKKAVDLAGEYDGWESVVVRQKEKS